MVEYWSRAVLGLTSNRFKIKSKHTMVRIFKIEFDVTKEGERNKRENTDEIAGYSCVLFVRGNLIPPRIR